MIESYVMSIILTIIVWIDCYKFFHALNELFILFLSMVNIRISEHKLITTKPINIHYVWFDLVLTTLISIRLVMFWFWPVTDPNQSVSIICVFHVCKRGILGLKIISMSSYNKNRPLLNFYGNIKSFYSH